MKNFKQYLIEQSTVKYAFETSQGSKYIINNDGRSRRIKSFHSNTGGEDQGLHEWQDVIVFTKPEDKDIANAGQYLMGHGYRIAFNFENNKGQFLMLDMDTKSWRPAKWGDAYKKAAAQGVGDAEKELTFTYVPYPVKDWNVLEFRFRPDKSIKSVHFGSPVSKVYDTMKQAEVDEFQK
jgi:hypothetical protein